MTILQDREKALEGLFAREAELAFKAYARRNKAAAKWVSEVLETSEAEAQAYALELIHIDIEDPSHEASLRKIVGDLEHKADEDMVREKLSEFLSKAIKDLAQA